MVSGVRLRRLTLTAACLALATVLQAAQPARRQPLNLLSFNIRYGTAKDGENRWELRRGLLFDVFGRQRADIAGLQEALAFQIDELLRAFPRYASIGVGRDDGMRKGEYAAILYDRGRFHVASAGTFWLSDTPEAIASKSWGNRITRICTWARLIDRDGLAFWVYNVHLDHESQPSRERSVALLRERIDARPSRSEPAIVMGDFNAGETNAAVTAMTAGARFVDSFRVAHPAEATVGTFTAFKPSQAGGDKIDYIFVEPGTEVLSASIVRDSRGGRVPSDHFPVSARVRLRD